MARLEQLLSMLEGEPGDAFLRYAVALEFAKQERFGEAMEHFGKLLEGHPDYVAGYFMAGRTCEQDGEAERAKDFYRRGIAAAQRTGDQHAAAEISSALAALE